MKSFGMWFLVVTSLMLMLISTRRNVDAAAINCGSGGNSGDESVAATITRQTITSDSASAKNLPDDETSTTSTTSTTPAAAETSDVKQFLHTVQCTLERAKPWVDQIEKEAKRLEHAAKRIGAGVISTFGDLMDKLIGSDGSGSILGSIIGGGTVGDAATEATTANISAVVVDIKADQVSSTTEGIVDAVAMLENEIVGSNAAENELHQLM